MTTQSFQLVIVGGGPAGLAAAIEASERGATEIVVIEKREEWGVPVQCAEYVPRMLARQITIPKEAVARGVERMEFFSAGEAVGSLAAPGFILHRDVFEASLAKEAANRGVTLIQPARVMSIHDKTTVIVKDASDAETELCADVLIGADGPRSLVRESVLGDGAENVSLDVGAQRSLPSGETTTQAEIHFSREYGAGYAWCFPKGVSVNAGLALHGDRRRDLPTLLDQFVRQLLEAGKISSTEPIRSTGGAIPVCGAMPSASSDRALLCGDAAGQAHPLTGAGIFTAISCGRMAGSSAMRALRRDDLSLLSKYETEWRSLFGGFLDRGRDAVERIESASSSEQIDLTLKAWGVRKAV